MDISGPQLGDVEVLVRANIDNLLRQFSKAKAGTAAFNADMAKVTKQTEAAFNEANQLEAEYRALARSYDPLTAAATKYGDALVRINRLQQAGLLTGAQARKWAGAARSEFDKTAAGLMAVGAASEKTRRGIGLMGEGWKLFVGLLGISTIEGAVRALEQIVEKSLESAAAIKENATAVGLTTTQFQQYQMVAKDLGLTQDDMLGAFREFNQTVRQAAAGLERPKRLFDLLGISINDASGQMRPMNELFLETIDKLGQVGNTAERSAGQAVAFGETFGPKMTQAVNMGAGAIDGLAKSVDNLLTPEEIDKADELKNKIAAINAEVQTDIQRQTIANADGILQFYEALGKLKSIFAQNITEDMVAFGAVVNGLSHVPGMFQSIANSIPPMIAEMLAGIPVIGLFVRALQLLGSSGGGVRGFNVAGASVTVPLGRATKPDGTRDGPGQVSLRPGLGLRGGGAESNISLAGLLAPKGRTRRPRAGGRGGRTVENQFDREELRAKEERLRLERAATADLVRQNEIDKEIIDIRVAERSEQLDQMVSRKALTAAQATKLKAEDAANALVEKELADRKMNAALIEKSAEFARETLDLEQDGLSIELRLARTDEERKKLELLILSSKQQQARLEIEKEIALAAEAKDENRVQELTEERAKLLENQNREIAAFDVEHLTRFERFRNDLPRTPDEIRQRADEIRFDKFQEKLDQAAQFADDVGSAFGNLAGDLARFRNPMDAFRDFIDNLAQTFTENFIVKPVEDWAKRAIGGPLAKQAFGKDLMKEGQLTTEQMNVALALATNNLNLLSAAAQAASGSLAGAGAAGAAGQAGGGLAGAFNTDPLGLGDVTVGGAGAAFSMDPISDAFGISVDTALSPFTDATQAATSAINQQIPILGQFGGGLMQVLNGLASGGGSGGGLASFLGMGLSLAGAAFGGGGGAGGLGLANSFGAGMGADAIASNVLFGFDSGGFTGRGHDDQVKGLVHANEWVFDAEDTRKYRPVFEQISAGRLPSAIPWGEDGPRSGGRKNIYNLGGVHMHGVRDDRTARRSARQGFAEIQRNIARVTKSGLVR